MPTKKRTKKENAASLFWFNMSKTNGYVVHKVSTSFLFSVKFIITGICIFRQLIQSSPASKKDSVKLDRTYTTGNLKNI